jgi:MFS family permease
MSPREIIKTPVARKRLLIGMSPGPFSCIAGNIIASYYLGSELDTAGITDPLQQLKANVVLNVWCLLCCLIGTHLAAAWGRKPTAILSQILLIACLFIIGGLSKVYADNPNGASQALVYGDVAVMFLFQGFYSIAWTPLLTLYPPEVMNYSIRANGVAFSSFMLNGLAYVLSKPVSLSLLCFSLIHYPLCPLYPPQAPLTFLQPSFRIHYAHRPYKYRLENVHGQRLLGYHHPLPNHVLLG